VTGAALAEAVAAAHRRHRPPAIGAALVDATGASGIAVAGTRIRGGDALVRTDDLWHIGSCAKSMTASLYARLVESGTAGWGAPLTELLPDLAGAAAPGWRSVTIDQVLTHRSGLPANLGIAGMRSAYADRRPLAEQRTAAAAAALARPPHHPGRFLYSNLGYVLAGAAIERLTGTAWEDAVVGLLLAPLGVRSAGFGAPAGDQPWGHMPRVLGVGRGRAVDPAARGRRSPPADNPPLLGPAGTLHLTLADWARFVAQFLEGGATHLSPASIDRILTVPPGGGPAQGMGWAHPARDAGLGGVGLGQQGSNRRWVATAVVSPARDRAALVTVNDGRTRMLRATATLGAALLAR
jgi:D-alanyl-D-alanine carboxypeptidase